LLCSNWSTFQIGNKRLKVQHKQIRDQDVHQDYDGYAGGHVMTAPPPSGADETAWYTQAPDNGVEDSGEGHVEDCFDGATKPVEVVKDPLSGFDPLLQALPKAGVTEST
jgi:hypothetical protein